MSIRKRTWTTAKGEQKTAWVVDYVDGKGTRRLKTFTKKKDADQFAATATVEVREGVHVADGASATVKQAGAFWIASAEAAGLERTTVDSYRSHVDLHIVPFIGETRLTMLSIPAVRAFEDELRAGGRSAAMIRKVMVSLGSLLADAQERGLTARNVVREVRGKRKGGERRQERRQKGKLKVGVDIPTREEVKAIVGALSGRRWRPLLLTAIFTGLRASELRGLRWSDVDLDRREVRVHQRADRFNTIGKPKSISGERTLPAPPIVINALREWRLICPKRDTGKVDADGKAVMVLDLVFPNGSGKVEQLNNIVRRGLQPALVAAGVTIDTGEVDEDGNPVIVAKYKGIHALRHFYASWCINRQEEGGLGLPLKVVQERMGHASVTMTADVYGHLFPRGDDADELARAENALLG
ncbi:site-specific integrase [Mesorhizobium loti]|uniref:Site-specific integrase n=1 Tax=Mesorhizobium jarvisii TaxID=1777867 RepID=A0A6M7TI42_9HYPH|nr:MULTISPECIES: site-specific integrase [Mesorhizobium]OBQ58045.1 integrase [Mesorhizobium loti]QKC63157.1 site-specific integrase [Mesorhizobium jarvisii]QKD09068.1 site-specific integrase [Mesorhizobium loti]RJT30164.1 site-specific integrase [Mesorhizobium jarvisii]